MASPGEGAAPALRVRELRKTYDNGVQARKGVSLDVMPGDFFALLGPNGAGKSTLIGITSSLVNLSAGSVEVFGIDLASQKDVDNALDDEVVVKLNKYDYAAEVGGGMDMFLPYFKFGIELKAAFGIPNLLIDDGTRFSAPIESIRSQAWVLTFTFEG